MRILLLGSTGRLGAAFLRHMPAEWTVLRPTTQELDLTNTSQVLTYLDQGQPDWIVNTTGYNAVDAAEAPEGTAQAYIFNAQVPETLALWSAKKSASLLCFSTDYVFDGVGDTPYDETSPPNPINVYGASKAEGEKRVLARHPDGSYIIRTSRLFGEAAPSSKAKKSFLDLIHRDAESRPCFRVNQEEYATPTLVDDLAKWVIEHFLRATTKPSAGIYHATGGGEAATWIEWARAYIEDARIPVTLIPREAFTLQRPAARPARLQLRTTKLPALRPWREAQREFLAAHPPVFTPHWYEDLGIDGVRVEWQRYIGNPDGGVMHLLPGGTDNPDCFAQGLHDVYAFTAQGKHTMRGGHYHHRLNEFFFPMSGTALWILSDFRPESPTFQKTSACILSVPEYTLPKKISFPVFSLIGDRCMPRIRVPAGVYHAIIPLTDERITVTALGSDPYQKDDYAYPSLQEIPRITPLLQEVGIDVSAITQGKT